MIAIIRKLWLATGFAFEGLRAAFQSELAFRMEVICAPIAVVLACYTGETPVERALLIGSVLLILIVELLNSAIETTVDRISEERHALAKKAKDIASAAVFMSLLNAAALWLIIWLG